MKKRVAFLTMHLQQSPEYQHFAYFAAGAAAHGYEAVLCGSADDVKACDPEFCFVMHMVQPKACDVPHYGTVQYPQSVLSGKKTNLLNFMTWDGYVTTAESCRRWVEDLLQQIPYKPVKRVGHYYLAGHTQPYQDKYKPTQLVYAGTGWDSRGIDLCRKLGEMLGSEFVIHGNPGFWEQHQMPSFRGFVDSKALCETYRHSACLSISNPEYLQQDIMTTRMHEAASVGSMTICPRTPSTMLMYGSNLYYYDGFASVDEQARQIAEAYRACKANAETETMRRNAHEWFKKTYAQDVMFGHLLAFHQYCQAYTAAAKSAAQLQPAIG